MLYVTRRDSYWWCYVSTALRLQDCACEGSPDMRHQILVVGILNSLKAS